VFFGRFCTKRELDEVKQELQKLQATWRQVQQEWDATADRVTKVLRRIRRAEQAQEAADGGDDTGQQPSPALPLTSLPTGSSRLDRIKAQMAGRAPIQKGE